MMNSINDLIQGIVISIIGLCLILKWDKFADEIAKFSVKHGRPQEVTIRVGFYLIGIVFIIGGIRLIYKFFVS